MRLLEIGLVWLYATLKIVAERPVAQSVSATLTEQAFLNLERNNLYRMVFVNSAFGRSTSRTYWSDLPADLESVYLTDDLKSCAIVRKLPLLPGVAYLDKFAVSKEERGNFNIEVLWQQLKHDYSALFWRSRHDNVFNSWWVLLRRVTVLVARVLVAE